MGFFKISMYFSILFCTFYQIEFCNFGANLIEEKITFGYNIIKLINKLL